MIRSVGIIFQDRNSAGFLAGIRARLNCDATLVDPPAGIGNTRDLPRRQARLAWEYFQKKQVDLVVRLTDADSTRWQDVRRDELKRIPAEASSIWICGVAVENVEQWLCLEPAYLADTLAISKSDLSSPENRVGVIKRAVLMRRHADEDPADVVARLVREAPARVFHRWLSDDALRRFYRDCRDASKRANCDTPNELGDTENE